MELIEHMAEGYSFESFAGLVGVGRTTLYNWAATHEEFAEAKDRAFAACLYWWEQRAITGLFARVESSGKGKERVTITTRLNAVVWRINMANRFAWREQQQEAEKPAAYVPPLRQPNRHLDVLSVEELKTLRDLLGKIEGAKNDNENGKGGPVGKKPVVN